MNTSIKILAILALAACGTSGASAKSIAARTNSQLTELSFKSKIVNREVIDIGKIGGSLGDMVIGNGDVMDLNGNIIGAVEYQGVVSHINADSEIRWLQSEYAFGDGTDSIGMEGAEEFQTPSGLPVLNRPQIFAVTGGTGKYFGANGQCLVHRTEGNNFITTCQFSTLKQPRK